MIHKYNSTKVVIDGKTFDSKLEANIYQELKKQNIEFELKPYFILQERFKFGKITIRAITYTADFKIKLNGNEYVIDAKGMETQVFKIKRKMFIMRFNQDIILIKSVKQLRLWLGENNGSN